MTQDDEYDFLIWYFPSDCTGEEDEVNFRKGRRFWGKWTIEYEGDMTDMTNGRGSKREFNLSTEDGSDRVAFAVKKRQARNFKPRYPHRRNIEFEVIE